MTGSPARIILVHGTWGRGFWPDKDSERGLSGAPVDPRWFEPTSKFVSALKSGLSGQVQAEDISAYLWSGANSINERQAAASGLAAELDKSLADTPEAQHFVIAHSHGGNVALRARQQMSGDARNVHLVTLATPFLSIFQGALGARDRLFAISLSIGLAISAIYLTYLFPPFLLALVALPFYLSKLGNPLYEIRHETPLITGQLSNLKIIRSPRDEASLALLGGKTASFMAHVAGALSIAVPIVASLLAIAFLCVAGWLLISLYYHYQACVAKGTPCVLPGEFTVLIGALAALFAVESVRFLAIGACASGVSIFLAALCKAFFGRELLFRSLNAVVDTYPTPGGSTSVPVDLCAPLPGNVFGLRHSIYNNPRAVEMIVAHIDRLCTEGSKPIEKAIREPAEGPQKSKLWRPAAALFVASFYTAALLWGYAPPGATTVRCALASHFEPTGQKGRFTALVARIDNDREGEGNKIADVINKKYGLHAIRSCMQVTTNLGDQSSADSIFSAQKAGLIISGKVTGERTTELQIKIPRHPSETVVLASNSFSEFLAVRLQRYLIRALANSYWEAFVQDDPKILAAGADEIDRFISLVDWSTETPNGPDEEIQLLRDKIFLEATAGQRMLDAALGPKDGSRAMRAVSHFERATAIRNGAGDYKEIISENWKNAYHRALLLDAQLNKTKRSAQLAVSIYSKEYQDAVAEKSTSDDTLRKKSDNAAAAAWSLYSITKDQDSLKSARRLACESLLRWRRWQDYVEEWERTPDPLAKKGLQQGTILRAPPAENSEAYKIFLALQKDPAFVLKSGSRIKQIKDCETF
ncbi:hypothetical protein AB7M45_002284 [Bradyrhizobium elkanii]|uniref:esterase/lipase family protein n=1 Tax=Bradyrhizobium elkanii TaxID=29448 RepID=UPI0002F48420|nr:hypothetical protein [Bradyrhizobium elkanii]MCW2189514.1 hypothetical protein [Bradyrhizobium elkanii]NWL73041.1 hypothetical protein [Bradyrhizobium elkanii]